jgi:hypothetical protein
MGDIRINGFDDMKKNRKILEARFRRQLEKTMNESALLVVARAKQNLAGKNEPHPYRHWITGNLSRSIKASTEFVSETVIESKIGTAVRYAPYIENLPDGGFLLPALKSLSSELAKKVYTDLRRLFRA